MIALLAALVVTATSAPDLIAGTSDVRSVAVAVVDAELGALVDVGADFIVSASHPEHCARPEADRLINRFAVLVVELRRRCKFIAPHPACATLAHADEHVVEARAAWRAIR